MQLLEQDRERKIYSNFVDSIAAEKTKVNYLTDLRKYLSFMQLWVKSENKKEDEWKAQKLSLIIDAPKEQIADCIKSYILYMRERQLSTSTMEGFFYAIKHFYDSNDIDLGILKWKKLKRFMGEATPTHEDRAYSKEEIKQLLKFCDPKLRAEVLLLASTGMRIGALSTMLKSHLVEKGDCYGIKVYSDTRGKGKYLTYCTPEARKAVEDYFQFREQYGEKIMPSSPLFRSDFNTGIPGSARYVKPLSYAALRMDIYEHLIKSGLRQVDHTCTNNRKEVMMSHGFRKFFRTQLTLAKVDPDIRRPFTGHKGLDEVYNRLSEDEIFTEYMKAIPFLTIDPSPQLQKQVEELKEEKNEVTIMEIKHRQTVNMLLEEHRKTKEENSAIKKKLEELKQQTTEEFEELEERLPDRVLEKLQEQLGKNGIDFLQWLKENDKKKTWENEKILIEENDFDYEIIPCALDKEEESGTIQVNRLKKDGEFERMQLTRLRRKK